jgi:hypothetical protein
LTRSIETIVTNRRESRKQVADVVDMASKLICFGAGAFGGTMAETLTKTFLEPLKLSTNVDEEVLHKRESEPQVQEIVNRLNVLLGGVQSKARKPVLVVVDGLDKLQRTEQAEMIFLRSPALRGPRCQLIYTVPMSIYTSLGFRQAEEGCKSFLLPNVKLYYKKSGYKYRTGYDTMQEVVSRRLQGLDLTSEDVFAPRVLDLLIKKSGDVMRWFVEMVQDACIQARIAGRPLVDLAAARRAVDDRATPLAMCLTRPRIEELRNIHREKWPSGEAEVGDLLHNLLIVAYRNSDTWFDAHPLIWDHLKT